MDTVQETPVTARLRRKANHPRGVVDVVSQQSQTHKRQWRGGSTAWHTTSVATRRRAMETVGSGTHSQIRIGTSSSSTARDGSAERGAQQDEGFEVGRGRGRGGSSVSESAPAVVCSTGTQQPQQSGRSDRGDTDSRPLAAGAEANAAASRQHQPGGKRVRPHTRPISTRNAQRFMNLLYPPTKSDSKNNHERCLRAMPESDA